MLDRLTGAGIPLGVVSDVGWDLRATFAKDGGAAGAGLRSSRRVPQRGSGRPA
ncbi:hypothetical protein [Streptomyces albidoflavus]|uniref:hypothetical protein n=1 Tax=Streptomyces albidoflavus TaxID=1886 RepID=UPI00332ACAB5